MRKAIPAHKTSPEKTSAFSNDTYLASIESEIITKFLIL
jgi:hypothetical protein